MYCTSCVAMLYYLSCSTDSVSAFNFTFFAIINWNTLCTLLHSVILKHLAVTSVRSRVVKYRIVSKVVPKLLGSEWTRKRTQKNNSREPQSLPPRGESASLDSWFEDRTRHKVVTGKTPRIGFKFAGCRPMTGRETRQPEEEQRCNGVNRSRIIVATRKLLRPLSNVQGVSRVYDLSSLHF